MKRCMGSECVRDQCVDCRRLPREVEDEEADGWLEPPERGPCVAWRDVRKAAKK